MTAGVTEIILNSKFFGSLSVEDLGRKVIELGYDGVDVNVREGHPVNPGNAVVALKEAVARWKDVGLTCPLATAPVDLVDPRSSDAEALYEACAAAGVPRLKLGFWRYIAGDDYWDTVARARGALDGFALLSQETGVQTCYQVHSGPNLGSNCAGLMHLIRGFDARLVGAYPDVGHMALDGEDWDMGFSMVASHLSIIGAKDAHHAPRRAGELPRYTPKFVKLGDGSIDWDRCVQALRRTGFDGPISVHTEYDFDETVIRQVGYADSTPPNLEQWAKEDAAFLKRALDGQRPRATQAD